MTVLNPIAYIITFHNGEWGTVIRGLMRSLETLSTVWTRTFCGERQG